MKAKAKKVRAVDEAKRRLYHELLCLTFSEMTDNEATIGLYLVKDRYIRKLLGRPLPPKKRKGKR